ncbi:MAG: purine-cytosine permease family protein [Nitrososphaerales archaeon]
MKRRATSIEQLGVEHIPEDKRHGTPRRIFTLWFAANLTIADFVIGWLCVSAFGLSVLQSIPVLVVGNIIGGLLVALSGVMGPKLGFPQMFSSRSVFGKKGNYPLGAMNWISTVGWFAVNSILGAEAIQVVYGAANFDATALILIAVQVLIAVYGHDFIHAFEKWMSLILGLIWLGVFLAMIPKIGQSFSYLPSSGSTIPSLGGVGLVLATSFSYIMSWSPYASDYSRYLPPQSSKSKLILFALAGGALASFGVEVIGAMVASLTPNNSNYFGALYSLTGSFGIFAILGVVFGAIAANALNIYTNSLTALVLDIRTKRWITVLAGGVVGFAITVIAGSTFETFFENFLLTLDYWITPWIGMILVDFFVLKRASPENTIRAKMFDFGSLAVYTISIVVSVPFMAPGYTIPPPWNSFVGALSGWFGGADLSYFVSFALACALYYAYGKRRKDV